MAKRTRKRGRRKGRRGGPSKMVCPKSFQGKRVRSSKGRCFIQIPVGKVPRASVAKQRCVAKRYADLRKKGAPATHALREAKKGCG